MKRLIVLFIVCISSLACMDDLGNLSLDPKNVKINWYWYYYSANVVVTDSLTGLIIEDPVRVYEPATSRYKTHENGRITIYDTTYTPVPYQPDPRVDLRAFGANGYVKTDMIRITFYKNAAKRPAQYITLKPI